MKWYFIAALAAAAVCLLIFLAQSIRLLRLGKPKDLSNKAGSVTKGVIYSFTAAMSPTQKESAYNHLPTYSAGILYHIGSFIVLMLFVWQVVATFTGWRLPEVVTLPLIGVLALSIVSGLGILVKRFVKQDLRFISSPDDYISNIIVTVSQIMAALLLAYGAGFLAAYGTAVVPAYYITMTLLLLWLPVGKTRHLLYFFFARFHLGYFYGWRNCWPINNAR